MLRLRFPPSKLRALAARFPADADLPVLGVADRARDRGHLTKREFMLLGDWKTPRSRPHRAANSEARVREATRLALGASDEALKIGILRSLEGVEWPTASVILHLCDRAPFPILDVRAMWSAGLDGSPRYTMALWLEYVAFTRALARGARCSMRDVDRALWQYSKETQR